MVKFINAYTGTEMFVADERVEEYKRAGHRLALDVPTVKTDTKEPVKKKTTKKK